MASILNNQLKLLGDFQQCTCVIPALMSAHGEEWSPRRSFAKETPQNYHVCVAPALCLASGWSSSWKAQRVKLGKGFGIHICPRRYSLQSLRWEAEKECHQAVPPGGDSTYGLRGSFGFCRLHMQVGHHGLQALFVFCKLMGREGFVMSLNTDVWLLWTPQTMNIPTNYCTTAHHFYCFIIWNLWDPCQIPGNRRCWCEISQHKVY